MIVLSDIVTLRVKRSETEKIAAISQFLEENGLILDPAVEVFVLLVRGGDLVACGGVAGDIIKCVAVTEAARGEGLALTLVTELIHLAYEMQRTDLFIYTKAENESFFRQCGFYTLAAIPDIMVLMENSPIRLDSYLKALARQRHKGQKIGAIVMNANPFTRGHRYLVEQAAAQCDWLHVFLVKEDASLFPYQDRLELVRQGISGIRNITVQAGSEYIISRATFPCYFVKGEAAANRYYIEIDLKIFRRYIAPALSITHRFFGTEPLCPLTAYYNRGMHYWLKTPLLPEPPITTVEINRLRYAGMPISASRVRRFVEEGNAAAIMPLVPETTLVYLQDKTNAFCGNEAVRFVPNLPQAKGET